MGAPYPPDLRKRVVAGVEDGGMSGNRAAAHYGVAISTAINWVKAFRRTGSLAPGPGRSQASGCWPKPRSGIGTQRRFWPPCAMAAAKRPGVSTDRSTANGFGPMSRRLHHIGQRITRQAGVKGTGRLGQGLGQGAHRREPAPRTINQRAMRIGGADNSAEIDLLRGTRQCNAPAPAAHGGEKPRMHQRIGNLHQMCARNILCRRNLGDGGAMPLGLAEMNKQAQRVVGMSCQLHGKAFLALARFSHNRMTLL